MAQKQKKKIKSLQKRVEHVERSIKLVHDRNDALTKIVTSDIKWKKKNAAG